MSTRSPRKSQSVKLTLAQIGQRELSDMSKQNGQYETINDLFEEELKQERDEYENGHYENGQYDHDGNGNDSFTSITSYSHQPSFSTQDTIMRIQDMEMEMKCDNPENWDWRQIKHWLEKARLSDMIPIFQNNQQTICEGINGHTLLRIDIKELCDDNGPWRIQQYLKLQNKEYPEKDPIIARFARYSFFSLLFSVICAIINFFVKQRTDKIAIKNK